MRTLCHETHIKKNAPRREQENDINNLTQIYHTTSGVKCQMDNYSKAAAIADKLSSIRGVFVVLTLPVISASDAEVRRNLISTM